MSRESLERLIARHEAFLKREPADRPLLGFWIGGYYPAEQFPLGTAGWQEGQSLHPEDVSFAPFAADYEALYDLHQQADDDFFFVGSAYWGLPWMEAILGCPVTAADANCRAESCLRSLEDVDKAAPNVEKNPWVQALMRFTKDLIDFSRGRFPVCPPLLRGPGDCASAMLGGTPFVLGFYDHPDEMARLLDYCARARRAVIERLHSIIPPWQGTHAAGGYPSKVWCRRTVAYHQEDSAAVLSPGLFRRFLLPIEQDLCALAEVNFIHLHSSCLYPVDILLEAGCYDVLEINIDHPGGASPEVADLLPVLRKIQEAGRPLLLWGELTMKKWSGLRRELSPIGLSVQPIVRRPQEVSALLEVLR